MSQVIAIVNQKSGVAKTTTTVNLAAALVQQGEKVLCVDLDPQANLTMSLGCQTPDELSYTIADVIDKAIAEEPIDPSEGVIHHAEGIDHFVHLGANWDSLPVRRLQNHSQDGFAALCAPALTSCPQASSSPGMKPCSSTNTAERTCCANMWTQPAPFTTTSLKEELRTQGDCARS